MGVMENLKGKLDNQRLFSSFNEYFISSHILLAGWCSVTLLFFILAFNNSVNINVNIIKIICICLSLSIIMLSYRSFIVMKLKQQNLIILTKNKKEIKLIKKAVNISYILSITFF